MRFQFPFTLSVPKTGICFHHGVALATALLAVSVACAGAAATPEPALTFITEPTATATAAPTETPVPLLAEQGTSTVDAFAVLEKFLEELGPRQSATEQELTAAKYLQSRFQEMGYATVLQEFTVEDISLDGSGLTLNTPQAMEFDALPMQRSGLGTVSGLLTPVGLAMPGDIPDGGLEGRIALSRRGVIPFQDKAENVFAAGAVGLVVYNNISGVFQGTLSAESEFPVISISDTDGESIEILLVESDIEVSISLTMKELTSRNVIAEKPGPGTAAVVLGGHYDTVPGISGANDNASGTAVLLAMAESLAGVDLPFTLRIIAFGSEELGLLGSQAYVQSLSEEELETIKAMLNFDALGSGSGVSIFGDQDLRRMASETAARIGVDVALGRGIRGGTSDFASFQAAGVPFLMVYGDDFSRIHSGADTIEFVQPELLSGATEVTVALLQSEEFQNLITDGSPESRAKIANTVRR